MTTSIDAHKQDGIIVTRDLARNYEMGGEVIRALNGVDLLIRRNEYVAIMEQQAAAP